MNLCGKVVLGFGIVGVLLLVAGLVIGFSAVLDGPIKQRIADTVRLENGTNQFDRWQELPFPLQFKVYAFNVTNPAEILAGEKPIVAEIGPWVYNQYRRKEDITYAEENDTLTYKQYLTFEFDAEESALAEDTNITVLNMPLQGIFLTIEGTPRVVSVNSFWPTMFRGDGYFLTVPAKTFFFEGYEFCIHTELNTILRLYCNQMKPLMQDAKTMTTESEKISFALFAYKENAADGEYQISAGNEDVNTLGQILSWEGLQYLDKWNNETSSCNQVRGSDSSIYPPFNNKSSHFYIFNTDICRIVNLKTTGTAEYEGIEGILATMNVEEMTNSGDKECYCIQQTKDLDGELVCLPDGFADMRSCLGAPSLASYPHMLWASKSYSDTIEGLEPDDEKHMSYVLMEPDTGTPLQGARRMQFNMITRPIEGLDVTSNLQPAVFPVVWVEEVFNLPEDLVQTLKDEYFSQLAMLSAVTWSLIGVGTGLIVICLGYFIVKIIRK